MRTIALKNTVYPSLGVESLVDKGVRCATFRLEQDDGYFVTFRKAVVDVVVAIYHINRNLVLKGDVTINDLYSFLGLPPTVYGEEHGWVIWDELYWIDFQIVELGGDIYKIVPIFNPVDIDEFYENY